MKLSRWMRRHGFKKTNPENWERQDAVLTRCTQTRRWSCSYKRVPLNGLIIPGAIGFGKTPRIAMASCHQEQAWRLSNPDLVRGSGRTTRMLLDCLKRIEEGLREVVLVGANKEHAQTLKRSLKQLAEQQHVSLSGVTIDTVTAFDTTLLLGRKTPIFEDHFAKESFLKQYIRNTNSEMLKP